MDKDLYTLPDWAESLADHCLVQRVRTNAIIVDMVIDEDRFNNAIRAIKATRIPMDRGRSLILRPGLI